MSTTHAARGYLGLLIGMLLWVTGCGGSMQLIPYTDAELAQEIFPFHLASAKPPPPPPEPKFFTHTISRSGETYMAIARWYTGEAANWKLISQANPGVDPRQLRLGLAIQIPEEIMTTRRPMPKPSRPKGEAATPDATEKPAQPADVELFGPIEKPSAQAKPGPIETTPELEPLK